MAVNDIASADIVGTYTPEQLFAGDSPVVSDAAPALAAIAKYQVCALTATGITPFVVGTHTAAQGVIAAQAASGASVQTPFFKAGYFNHAVLGWPAGATLDTYAERKAFFIGTMIQIGHIS